MKFLNTIAGSGVALVLTFTAPIAWGQSLSNNADVCGTSGASRATWPTYQNVSQMDQNLSRQIKQAWSEGKNATAAMAFQENGEIALSESKEQQARQYFQAAERELMTLTPDRTSD